MTVRSTVPRGAGTHEPDPTDAHLSAVLSAARTGDEDAFRMPLPHPPADPAALPTRADRRRRGRRGLGNLAADNPRPARGSKATTPASVVGRSPSPGTARSTRRATAGAVRMPSSMSMSSSTCRTPRTPRRTAADAIATRAAIQLISTLPRHQAEAVLLRVVVGLDAVAAGRVLGKRPGAVRHRHPPRPALARRAARKRGGVMLEAVLTLDNVR